MPLPVIGTRTAIGIYIGTVGTKKTPQHHTHALCRNLNNYLDADLERRGYTSTKYVSLEGGYYCRPTMNIDITTTVPYR